MTSCGGRGECCLGHWTPKQRGRAGDRQQGSADLAVDAMPASQDITNRQQYKPRAFRVICRPIPVTSFMYSVYSN